MIVEGISHDCVNEAYTLLSAYVREDGKIGANYNKEHLKEFVVFLSEILKNPKNFAAEELLVEDTGKAKTIPV